MILRGLGEKLKERFSRVKKLTVREPERDSMTGLPTKAALMDMSKRLLNCKGMMSQNFAVMSLDIDFFKQLNHTTGHQTGDIVLQEVARRIRMAVRHGDIVSRSGGDEFIIVLPDIVSEIAVLNIADRVLNEIGLPIVLDETQQFISATIGIALSSEKNNDLAAVLHHSDIALRQAKTVCRGTIYFFDRHMEWDLNRREKMAEELRIALENNELFLQYQPIIDLKNSTIPQIEALVRWQHKELGLVPPADFIPVAEAVGLIQAIGSWVLQQVISDFEVLDAHGLAETNISLNISPEQLKNAATVDAIIELSAEKPERRGRIVLEVTEDVVVDERYEMNAKLSKLRDVGFRIVLDNFGTGNASIGRLRQFEFDKIKIDRSLIANIDQNETELDMVRSIMLLASSLNVELVAGGVETTSCMETLKREGCCFVQGYHFSKPKRLKDIIEMIKEREETSDLATMLKII